VDTELDRAAARRQGRARGVLGLPARAVAAVLRRVLVRYARGRPRGTDDGPPKVTILMVSGWGKGGTTRTMLNVAEYLAERHEVEIISLWRLREEPVFDHPPGVRVTALDDLRPAARPRGLRGLPRRVLAALPSALVEPGDRWSSAFSLLSDIRLVRMLRGERGILIATRPTLNLMAALLDPPGLTLIGSEHMHLSSHKKPIRRAMRRLYPRLDAFVVLTEGGLRDYEKHLNGDDVKLLRIPNSARDLGEPADLTAKTVLAAGRLTKQKGFDLLVPAWAQVAEKHPDWRLRICGEGLMRPRLEELVSEHGLGDSIELPGACDMDEAMGSSSIFVMSSRYEGFPLILIEAMSKAMAVVSFDCPTGPADVIDNGRNGLLVPFGDVDALGRAILELIEDEDLRRRCGPAAAETAATFRIENIGPMWEELFEELRPGRSPTSR
jgi:glycosyltransferase involved in cell wall biosynthesis